MTYRLRTRLLRTAGALTLITALLGPGLAGGAAAQTAAVELTSEQTGRLAPGGNFAYYTFFYEANGSVATINMDVTPDSALILRNVGFRVYGPNGQLAVTSGAQPGLNPEITANVIRTGAANRGTYTVQVFNYDPATAVDYRVWGSGALATSAAPAAPAPAAPAPTTGGTAAPSTPAPTTDDADDAQSGTLAGGTEGHFEAYQFDYPGNNAVYTLNMQVSPGGAATLRNAGFHVYGPNGNLVVTGGAQPGLTPNVSANVISTRAGTYTVQVYNYNPTPVDYEVSLVAR